MKIIQFTDIHIDLKGKKPHGVDVRKKFTKILGEIVVEASDMVVLTGDLCANEGDETIYKWIGNELRQAIPDIPVLLIPGNHDDARLMSGLMNTPHLVGESEMYYSFELKGQSFVFLDTSSGIISAGQLAWLRNEISLFAGTDLIVFMHHPPVKAQVKYMDDNYPLKNGEELMAIFNVFNTKQFHVFCGHYHVEKSILLNNVSVFITPSTYFQINQEEAAFKVDHYYPAYRIIELEENMLLTTVRYLAL